MAPIIIRQRVSTLTGEDILGGIIIIIARRHDPDRHQGHAEIRVRRGRIGLFRFIYFLTIHNGNAIIAFFRDVAQSGSAPEWGSGGPEFKSPRPDHKSLKERAG